MIEDEFRDFGFESVPIALGTVHRTSVLNGEFLVIDQQSPSLESESMKRTYSSHRICPKDGVVPGHDS